MNNETNSTNSTFEGNGTNTGYVPPPPKNFWRLEGLLLPTIYLTILIGSLYAFSSLYRKRQQARQASLEPYLPPHKSRDIYLSLLHLDPIEASESGDGEKKLSKVPDSVLKAALLRRAVEDIQRIVQLRMAKPALQTLLQRGSVGDELMQRFQRAEQEMELEVKDVVNEANAFAPNWGQTIFQSANEINQNILLKKAAADIQVQLDSERAWWDRKKTGIQSDFMKELEQDTQESSVKSPDGLGKKSGSDDDAVLVDAGGPVGTQGGAKKKKGKK
ncbi:hypothetical protein K431DRAFT_292631 [Polychaeton citri CBS 116435]|uniref:Translocation protein sec66 n=1 Tax=Polychaeton citri CBS 116435 TaxID=1314669 RepID=A0A9P4UQU8_9PEZI|nr:hypothetical protein K431DRAFT_292631 [Polychaeton citri CBS 116435]